MKMKVKLCQNVLTANTSPVSTFMCLLCSLLLTQLVYAQTDQDSLTNRSHFNLSSLQISLHRGFWLSGDGAQPGELTALGIGGIFESEWWVPSVHGYLSYADYQFSQGLTSRITTRVRAISVSPSVRLFSFLLVGISYSYGKKEQSQLNQSLFRNEVTEETYSRLSGIIGAEIDIRVYSDLYLSGGITLVSPYSFAFAGFALRFR